MQHIPVTRLTLVAPLLLLAVTACERQPTPVGQPVPEVIRVLPHDPGAYTQGLLLHGDVFYESTGQYGRSTLREVDRESGTVIRSVALDEEYFGEGLALVGDRLIQLTWREGVAFVYDRSTFRLLDTFRYQGEGWGLCFDGTDLFMTDGSATLQVRDPATFALRETRTITLEGLPLTRVNEMACVGDDIYANVYLTDLIVRIDKATGAVRTLYDAAPAVGAGRPLNPDAVLNGIAWNPQTGTFYITGKLWPLMFEVRLPR